MSNCLNSKELGFATAAIHCDFSSECSANSPIVPPITPSSAYHLKNLNPYNNLEQYIYSRLGNPGREALEKTIAALEEGDYGVCTSSGLAAAFIVSYLLNPGDHIVSSQNIYGGTFEQFEKYVSHKGIEVTFTTVQSPSDLVSKIKQNTKMIYIESCSNPTLTIIDIPSLSKELQKYPEILLVVDNTFMTPYFQKPLTQGADIVLHSLSKYMNGHGDIVMGAIVTKQLNLYEKLKDILTTLGPVPSPLDCYFVSRSLKTLHLRMKEHMRNAFEVAKFLEAHPLVEKVLYPGLSSHPQHILAKSLCSGFSGMIGMYICGGRKEVETFLENLQLIKHSGSLGQPESLICYPATLSHSHMKKEDKLAMGVTENYLRLSIGLESTEDIIRDISRALEFIKH